MSAILICLFAFSLPVARWNARSRTIQGLLASLPVTFPGLLSGEGVNAGFRVDGLTALDYLIRPRRPILSFLLSPSGKATMESGSCPTC